MITLLFLSIIFLLHFQIDKVSEYFLQFNTLSSSLVIESLKNSEYIQLIRIFTFNLFHKDLNHLLMNSIGLINYGTALERYFKKYSIILFPKIFFLLMFLSGTLTVLINYLIYLLYNNVNIYNQTVCGLSGVLFGLQFIYSYLFYNDFYIAAKIITASIFYVHLFFPDTSLVGHLSGFASGIIVSTMIKSN